jgi:pimeloyl-[acyl-carrier protein] synthase
MLRPTELRKKAGTMNTALRNLDFGLDECATLGNSILERLNRLREEAPIFWSERNSLWMVAGHREVADAFGGKYPLSNVRLPDLAVAQLTEEEKQEHVPYLLLTAKNWLLNMDAPEHPRLRKLMLKAFGRSVVEGLRPHARRFIQEALDEAGTKGEVEFVSQLGRIIPGRTILKQLGLADELLPKLHYWSVILNQSGNVNLPLEDLKKIEQVLLEMRSLFIPEIEKRRKNPSDDFLSALVTANEAGDQLSLEEMLGICYITLIAGHDTTANTMALVTAALAEHPGACEQIRQHPENIANEVMELSRIAAMSTAMSRRVAKDFVWNGFEIKEGQYVVMFMAGANRDPSVFPDPEKIDFARPQEANMTFAPGLHHCIGHLLAKMQLAEFFPELVRRFDIELRDKRLDFSPVMSFRGLETLHVRLIPRAN